MFELNDQQCDAIYLSENWYHLGNDQVFEISGPAGAGKTTILMQVIERLGLDLSEVLFMAFMGKAVTQMIMHGLPAKTIHAGIYDYVDEIVRDKETNQIVRKQNGAPKLKKVFKLKERLKKRYKLIVIDEGSTVSEEHCKNILSFGLPVLVLGDLNQLPPPFGKPYFLRNPNVILTKVMRQAENSPIIWLSQEVLKNHPLRVGTYGKSRVIRRDDISLNDLKNNDMILCCTNALRYNVNMLYRESVKQYKRLDMLHIGEKMICRKNNWNKTIGDGIFLTNGTTGFIENTYRDTYNGKTMLIDFVPDFDPRPFRNVSIDFLHVFEPPKKEKNDNGEIDFVSKYNDVFEFGNAITVNSSQGSQYGNVLFLYEDIYGDSQMKRSILYTAITRAINSVTIVL